MTSQQAPKPQSIKMGWRLIKSALQTLGLHKRLAALPIASVVVTVVFLAVWWACLALVMTHVQPGTPIMAVALVALIAVLIAGVFAIRAIFYGAIMHGALQAYAGVRTTIGENIHAGIHRFWPLLAFNFMMSTVGVACSLLADRLPLVGNVLIGVANTSWKVANYFSVPTIMTAPKAVGPFAATKKSVNLLASVWGESLVTNVGIGGVMFLFVLGYMLLGGFGLYATGRWLPVLTFPLLGLLVVGLIVLSFYVWVLDAITKAALYHFATTRQTPEAFDTAVVQSAMTRRSARKAFKA
ncbi:MAG TPA: DUF6159 family protein [Candidatus Saccharimonas sp.]|nr:DUF6159 family protein [Candidatus Saccharimonas sp.]